MVFFWSVVEILYNHYIFLANRNQFFFCIIDRDKKVVLSINSRQMPHPHFINTTFWFLTIIIKCLNLGTSSSPPLVFFALPTSRSIINSFSLLSDEVFRFTSILFYCYHCMHCLYGYGYENLTALCTCKGGVIRTYVLKERIYLLRIFPFSHVFDYS